MASDSSGVYKGAGSMLKLRGLVATMQELGVIRLRMDGENILEVELAPPAGADASYPPSATARDVDPTTAEPEEHKPVLLPSGKPACVRCKVLPPAGLVPGHCRACGKIAAYGN